MIFNRWFWISLLGSVLVQTVHWRPAMADVIFPEPRNADWICYHADSSVRTYGRMPAIRQTEASVQLQELVRWSSTFAQLLEKSMPAQN